MQLKAITGSQHNKAMCIIRSLYRITLVDIIYICLYHAGPTLSYVKSLRISSI